MVLMAVRPVPDVAATAVGSGRSDARCGGGLTHRRSDREQLSTDRAQSGTFVVSLAPVVEIFCRSDGTATQSRYGARGGSRHDGHCRLWLASS
jgi:hypothetical protein